MLLYRSLRLSPDLTARSVSPRHPAAVRKEVADLDCSGLVAHAAVALVTVIDV